MPRKMVAVRVERIPPSTHPALDAATRAAGIGSGRRDDLLESCAKVWARHLHRAVPARVPSTGPVHGELRDAG